MVHALKEYLFHDGAKATRSSLGSFCALRNRAEGGLREVEPDAVGFEEGAVLLEQRVAWRRHDVHHLRLGERAELRVHREAPDELGQEAVADQVVHGHGAAAQHRVRLDGGCGRLRLLLLQLGAEADGGGLVPLREQLLQPREGAAADEEDVGRVDGHELRPRVLAPAALGHVDDGALEHLEQSLLHALARDVARHRDGIRLARELVHLVDVDDPHLRRLDVLPRLEVQPVQDTLDVLAHVARLREARGVGDREGHVHQPRERACDQSLARARRA
mmetsp:Transcript_23937/g.57174  ORF Transcript_23937/g.57174 Transcript_23937/m.57174 type:complete len:275 (+) Transcript_23937:352-1176(+)